jgi:iron(II)-dependent oxidoreductase
MLFRPTKLLAILLLAAIPLCLLLAWGTGHWTVGAAGGAAALCLLALWQPAWLTGLFRRGRAPSDRVGRSAQAPEREATRSTSRPARKAVAADSLAGQMLAQGRGALLLRPQIAATLSQSDLTAAQEELDATMSIVPQGPVAVRGRCYDALDAESAHKAERLILVQGYFLDRWPVTNALYQTFVAEGGYEQMSLWDEAIWPAVLGFVDSSGQPGPRYWKDGACPRGQEDHPVVGVSWYEACAFARWAGKRLPTDPEWVKAGSWPVLSERGQPIQRKYPWGDAMDRSTVNLWGMTAGGTVSVYEHPESASVGGIQQLVGNVWEWTSSAFGAWEPATRRIETLLPLKSIRGGAFDTYFDTQASCQFQSGESPLARRHNVGFRCALGFCDVVHMADDPDADATDELPGIPSGEEVLA